MREQLRIRLEVLKKEFETGQSRLQEVEKQQSLLRETLLRISGAIQVLQEELGKSNGDHGEVPQPSDQKPMELAGLGAGSNGK